VEPEIIDAIGDYLLAHIERHGHARTAEAFGVSRHTLWRFLERGQPGRALPRAVMREAGDTPGKLAAATRALAGDARRAPLARSRTPRLTQALRETLELVCETPFASAEELSRLKRVPNSTLREQLGKLRGMGLVASHPHRLAMLTGHPVRRFIPTATAIAVLADDDHAYKELLRRHPVSRQWLRLLAERLDGVALVYELAALIADADRHPVRVEHCRRGPYDALLTLAAGRTFGVVRQGAALSAASLRYRIRTIERLDVQELPHVTLIATDSDQDTRRAVRALAKPSTFHHSAVATLGAVIGEGAWGRVWQTGGYGYGKTPVVAPHASLAGLVDLASREAGHPVHAVLPKRRQRWLYQGGRRTTPPADGEVFGDAPALRLMAAEKRALDLLAAWPLCTTEQLANLMGGLSERRANQLLRPLRRLGLARRDGEAHVLTDEGLTYLARRDRSAVGPMLDRWTPQQDGGVYIGSALRALASQREHQRGLAEFVSRLALGARSSRDHELLDLLPTHRSQITYRHDDTGYVIHPDASFQLGYKGAWTWYLLEYERRATTPRRLPERLVSYRRYFRSGRARLDHGERSPMVLFVFESEHAERAFLRTAAGVPEVPLASATVDSVGCGGPLGAAWRLPAPAAPERRRLHFLQ
jgi:hypothetical protein